MAVNHAGRFLEPALRSLANQTFKDFEVILVDNNSRDGSDRVIAEWAAKDERIRPYRMDVLSAARCLNFATSVARAPLLARLDGTDVLLPDRLRIQHARMEQEPQLGLLGACVDLIDTDDNVVGHRDLPLSDQQLRTFLRHGNPFVQSTIMMRRAAFEAVGGYRISLRTSSDFDLWCRMAEVTQMANMRESLARFRVIEGGIPASRPIRMALTDCLHHRGGPRARKRQAGTLHQRRREPSRSSRYSRCVARRLQIPAFEKRRRHRASRCVPRRYRLRQSDCVTARSCWRAGCRFEGFRAGFAYVAASYFPSGSRQRRKLAVTRLLGAGERPATDR